MDVFASVNLCSVPIILYSLYTDHTLKKGAEVFGNNRNENVEGDQRCDTMRNLDVENITMKLVKVRQYSGSLAHPQGLEGRTVELVWVHSADG